MGAGNPSGPPLTCCRDSPRRWHRTLRRCRICALTEHLTYFCCEGQSRLGGCGILQGPHTRPWDPTHPCQGKSWGSEVGTAGIPTHLQHGLALVLAGAVVRKQRDTCPGSQRWGPCPVSPVSPSDPTPGLTSASPGRARRAHHSGNSGRASGQRCCRGAPWGHLPPCLGTQVAPSAPCAPDTPQHRSSPCPPVPPSPLGCVTLSRPRDW